MREGGLARGKHMLCKEAITKLVADAALRLDLVALLLLHQREHSTLRPSVKLLKLLSDVPAEIPVGLARSNAR